MPFIKDENDKIFQEILMNFLQLAKTEKGLNVLKVYIANVKLECAQKLVVQEIVRSPFEFIEHIYCNYATQIVIRSWPSKVTAPLFYLILGKIERFSVQRAASNVVEAMMIHSPAELRCAYFKEIAAIPELQSTRLNRNYTK